MKRSLLFCAALLWPAFARADEAAAKLFSDYWATQMRLSPLTATFYGVSGYDDLLDDNGPDGRAGPAIDLETFLDSVRKNPKNFFTTREEVRKTAEALVEKTKSKLPDWFGVLPKTELVVKPVEEFQEKNEAAARYFPPPTDYRVQGCITSTPTSRKHARASQ